MTSDANDLRQSIWDLVYGLLSADEAQEVIARIKSDPAAARMYAEVRLEADLVAQAARVTDSALVLRTTDGSAKAGDHSTAARPQPKANASHNRRDGTWLAALGTTALILLLAAGLFWPRGGERLASDLVAVDLLAQQ